MKYTENLSLKKPDLNDYVNVEVINENMDALDLKINEIETNQVDIDTNITSRVLRTGDTMSGALKAHPNINYTTAQVRNIILSPDDANVNSMQNSEIWIKYK